jgi:hypothetical protein
MAKTQSENAATQAMKRIIAELAGWLVHMARHLPQETEHSSNRTAGWDTLLFLDTHVRLTGPTCRLACRMVRFSCLKVSTSQ